MLYTNIFDNQIDLYWDKIFKTDKELDFIVYLNGDKVGTTEFTHYEFYGLTSETDYTIYIEAIDKSNLSLLKKYEAITVRTKPTKKKIDITESPYNAVGDGKTLNTKAIQAALDDCKADEKVYIPKGVFLTGALDMHSNTELYIEKGGILQGSSSRDDYMPMRLSRFEGYEIERFSALINVGKIDHSLKINCENVVIRGEGEILGGGEALANDVIEKGLIDLKADIDKLGKLLETYDRIEVIPGRLRPFMIDINNCDTAIITGLKIGYGSAWNIHFVYSKNITVSHCEIGSVGIWNGDGIDPDSSINTVIYDVVFDTHDDAIAIKSGKNPEGNKINAPTKNLKIFHMRGSFGIAIGSELSGGIEDVKIWDVDIYKGTRGFRIKTSRDRGGYVKNVMLSNVKVPAFFVDTIYSWNGDGEPAGTLTEIDGLYFENITVKGNIDEEIYPWAYLTLYGFEERESFIKNITLNNVTVYGGCDASQAVMIKNTGNLKIKGLNVLSEFYKG